MPHCIYQVLQSHYRTSGALSSKECKPVLKFSPSRIESAKQQNVAYVAAAAEKVLLDQVCLTHQTFTEFVSINYNAERAFNPWYCHWKAILHSLFSVTIQFFKLKPTLLWMWMPFSPFLQLLTLLPITFPAATKLPLAEAFSVYNFVHITLTASWERTK